MNNGRRARSVTPPRTQFDLEVLICTHNRANLLEKALHSLQACAKPKGCSVGLFVVANACSDGTTALLEKLAGGTSRFPLRWMEVPHPGKSHALNTALPRARGRLIAFVDDDHRVDSGYLESLARAATTYPEAELFCGRILPDWKGDEPEWVHDTGPYRIYPLPVPRFELDMAPGPVPPGSAIPGGGNLAIRRELFQRVGPFRTELGPNGHNLGGAEDIEWVRRAIEGGARLYYLPDMLQFHYVDSDRLTLSYLMRKAYERSASTVRLQEAAEAPFGVPPFMIRKTLSYLAKAAFSLAPDRRRFYCTRLAASLGEIKGFRQQKKDRIQGNAG